MIDTALEFISKVLNTELQNAYHSDEQQVTLGHVGSESITTPLVISLLSIEEESVTRNVTFKRQSSGNRPLSQPDDHVNLYVILAINKALDYSSGLDVLSSARRFIINNPIHDARTHAMFPKHLLNLTLEVHNLSLDTQSRVWQSLGQSYLPSIVIKIRVVSNPESRITTPKSTIT
ncbi:Pvc16 family protein [Psychroserpens luteus]|uniref:Pvc16 family protein n=1 Tax=Psychroserpens luteus TaxID=1434066 RepID=A0ABW5ZSP6_9FLAO|nr:Pvc16 family protein [Psychroserpens luteus]